MDEEQYDVCVYVGLGRGYCIPAWIPFVKRFIGIEANPTEFHNIWQSVSNLPWRNKVELLNAAASDKYGTCKLNVTENIVSSSIYPVDGIEVVRTTDVLTIDLYDYLYNIKELKYIDLYVSDTQGHDLTLLKTLQPYLDSRDIGTIHVETYSDGSSVTGQYKGSQNELNDYLNYKSLENNYRIVTTINNSEEEYDTIWQSRDLNCDIVVPGG